LLYIVFETTHVKQNGGSRPVAFNNTTNMLRELLPRPKNKGSALQVQVFLCWVWFEELKKLKWLPTDCQLIFANLTPDPFIVCSLKFKHGFKKILSTRSDLNINLDILGVVYKRYTVYQMCYIIRFYYLEVNPKVHV